MRNFTREKRNLQRRRGSGTTFLHPAKIKEAGGVINRDAFEFVLGCPWPPDSWLRTENFGTTRFGVRRRFGGRFGWISWVRRFSVRKGLASDPVFQLNEQRISETGVMRGVVSS